MIPSSQLVEGLWIGPLEEKIKIYADDALQYLHHIFDKFSQFNWSKSVLFPLDPRAWETAALTLLKWVDEFKCLGIQIKQELLIVLIYTYCFYNCGINAPLGALFH